MKYYIRDLEDGTVQRVAFAEDPGKSTPQWRLDDTPRNAPEKKAKAVKKTTAKKKAKK
jgi:hypothetical protein|tara:strand:+ start:170 stop:343 length:174 start_codon:yes stop_codon:yes gene_type:complete